MLKKHTKKIIIILLIFSGLSLVSIPLLTYLGNFLIRNDALNSADAIIVLTTGVDYYPRLTEAARIYKKNLAGKVVINGNRKSGTLRAIEALGYKPPCHWSENFIQILVVMGVPREKIVVIDAEDVFDTNTEAKFVGNYVYNQGIRKLIIVTSKFHTHRAGHIWEGLYSGKFTIAMAAAKDDPFDPAGWWKRGRQIRALLGEYGGWFYYYWQA